MAEVEVTEVEVPVTTTTMEKRFVLTLTEDEATAVKFLVGKVSGNGRFREAVADIWRDLNVAGVDDGDTLYWDNRHLFDTIRAEKVVWND